MPNRSTGVVTKTVKPELKERLAPV